MKNGSQSWTQLLLCEVEAYRRAAGMSREAFAMEVASQWASGGAPEIGRAWKTDGDVFAQGRVNQQRLYRWLDDQTKDCTLLPANAVPAILAALPEEARARVLNAQLSAFGLMVERTPDGESVAAVNELLAADIKESSEAHQALVALASDPSRANLERARREIVEEIAAASAALHFVDERLQQQPTAH